MIRSLHTAATGMDAQQTNIDVIANNLSNVNMVGFKRARAEFQDIMYQQMRAAGNGDGTVGNTTPTNPLEVGQGVMTIATQKMFGQGDMIATNNELDFAIEGEGFLKVKMPDESISYTRNGVFKRNADGLVVNAEGYPMEPPLTVPAEALQVIVELDGIVKARMPGETEMRQIGQVEMAVFVNPAGLESLGHNLLAETEASGVPIDGVPGEEGVGNIRQGMLESSNVKVMEEMIGMITSQRAYEINSKVIQTADQMLGTSSNLR